MSHCSARSPASPVTSNKQFWTEFIQLFKEQPCLWDRKCEEYYNETMKSMALGLLLEKMWEIDANADIDTVKNKIWNFRKYYKETKRRSWEKTKPSNSQLWYYTSYLDFLSTQDDCNYMDNDDDCSIDSDSSNKQTQPAQRKRLPMVSVTDLEKSMNIDISNLKYRRKLPKCNAAVGKNLEGNSSKQDDLNETREDSPNDNLLDSTLVPNNQISVNEMATDAIEINEDNSYDEPPTQQGSTKAISEASAEQDVDDDCSVFAAYFKTKMRTFDPLQKCIAQKLISDVLYYASIKELNVNSKIQLNKKP